VTVLAIDPGPEESAYVLFEQGVLTAHGKEPNDRMMALITRHWPYLPVVFEQVASYGMAVGAEVFETVFWTGRMCQAVIDNGQYPGAYRLYRRDVKLHLCGQVKAKDANIRQALIDRFGGKEKAIGRKASPGPLYGLKADEWQALALAVTFHDQRAQKVA
jgi:hypothetical protein